MGRLNHSAEIYPVTTICLLSTCCRGGEHSLLELELLKCFLCRLI